MYRYTIHNDKMAEVQTLIADHCDSDGTLLIFATGGRLEMLYNLPVGYSVTLEVV